MSAEKALLISNSQQFTGSVTKVIVLYRVTELNMAYSVTLC